MKEDYMYNNKTKTLTIINQYEIITIIGRNAVKRYKEIIQEDE